MFLLAVFMSATLALPVSADPAVEAFFNGTWGAEWRFSERADAGQTFTVRNVENVTFTGNTGTSTLRSYIVGFGLIMQSNIVMSNIIYTSDTIAFDYVATHTEYDGYQFSEDGSMLRHFRRINDNLFAFVAIDHEGREEEMVRFLRNGVYDNGYLGENGGNGGNNNQNGGNGGGGGGGGGCNIAAGLLAMLLALPLVFKRKNNT